MKRYVVWYTYNIVVSFGVKAIGQIRPIYDDSYVGEMSLREDTYPRPCVFRWPAPYLVAFISQSWHQVHIRCVMDNERARSHRSKVFPWIFRRVNEGYKHLTTRTLEFGVMQPQCDEFNYNEARCYFMWTICRWVCYFSYKKLKICSFA